MDSYRSSGSRVHFREIAREALPPGTLFEIYEGLWSVMVLTQPGVSPYALSLCMGSLYARCSPAIQLYVVAMPLNVTLDVIDSTFALGGIAAVNKIIEEARR